MPSGPLPVLAKTLEPLRVVGATGASTAGGAAVAAGSGVGVAAATDPSLTSGVASAGEVALSMPAATAQDATIRANPRVDLTGLRVIAALLPRWMNCARP